MWKTALPGASIPDYVQTHRSDFERDRGGKFHGLPTLYRTRPNLAVARNVVEQLLPPGVLPPSDDELAHLFDLFHGNLRELLFALYDRYEPDGSR